MRSLDMKVTGQVMTEFIIVAIFLALMVWYAVMGGSGPWNDANRQPNHGNLEKAPPPADGQAYPGLIQVLNDRQHDFSDSLSQP